MVQVGGSLVIFAENGIWELTGPDAGFKANEFVLGKISDEGILSETSVVIAAGVPYYLAETGIFRLVSDTVSGRLQVQPLTDETIKTFYTDIGAAVWTNADAAYDSINKTIVWLYKVDSETPSSSSPYYYNRALLFDTLAGAFYPWKFEREDDGSPFVAGVVQTRNINATTQELQIVDSSGDEVIDSNLDNVITDDPVLVRASSVLKYLTIVPNTGDTDNKWTFSETNVTTFHDWVIYDTASSVGANYSSYIETGYYLGGNFTRYKQAPYITVHSKRTETGFIDSGGELIFSNPSSLFMQARWEWSDNSNSGKFGTNQQVYKFRRNYIPDLIVTGKPVSVLFECTVM